jgi:hypothetical protein
MSRLSVAGTTEAGGTQKVTPDQPKKNLHACIRVHLLTCVKAGIEVTDRVHLLPN